MTHIQTMFSGQNHTIHIWASRALPDFQIQQMYLITILPKRGQFFISVAEQGTRAGAATVVVMVDGCALEEEPPKVVTLDRPFVYMLIDTATGTPFFIGTMMDPGE